MKEEELIMMTLMELQEMLGKQIRAIDEAIGGTKDFQCTKCEWFISLKEAMDIVALLQEIRKVR